MRIAFAGTPAFAATGLAALLDAGFEVCLVLSQPDRPAGRGQHLRPGPVNALALSHGITVLTPASLRPERGGFQAEQALAQLRALAPDVLVVAAYGLMLPEAVLQIPRGLALAQGKVGAINIHASLLPRWRGAAPVVRAIEAGDVRTGVSIMQMDAGLDTGPILLMESIDIDPTTTAAQLTEQLAQLGGRMIVSALQLAEQGRLRAQPQPAEGVVYAHKVQKRESWIDWQLAPQRIAAKVRAFDPFPGACSVLDGVVLKIWRAHVLEPAEVSGIAGAMSTQNRPGMVLDAGPQGIVVSCGPAQGTLSASRWLCVTQLQRPGGKRLDAREFLAGTPIARGSVWRSEPAGGDER
jgi:methionyl-tRNA formyltransferase